MSVQLLALSMLGLEGLLQSIPLPIKFIASYLDQKLPTKGHYFSKTSTCIEKGTSIRGGASASSKCPCWTWRMRNAGDAGVVKNSHMARIIVRPYTQRSRKCVVGYELNRGLGFGGSGDLEIETIPAVWRYSRAQAERVDA